MGFGMTKEHTRRRFRYGKEDGLRSSLANPPQLSTAERRAKRRYAEGALASAEALEVIYLEDRNPVHVWDAIVQIHYASPILDIPIQLPPWVLAYLITAASEIMGRAVAHPSGNRHRPKAPIKNPDGTMTRFSDSYAGLTAAQRRDVVLEALGFMGPRGRNPIAQARRDSLGEMRVIQVNALRRQGHSASAAAEQLDDHDMKYRGDPARKMRHHRRKLRGES